MIIIGNDHGGYELAMKLYSQMSEKQWHVHHIGCCSTTPTHYPLFAQRMAEELGESDHFRGILICGPGIGMCMAAYRHYGVRAALCERPSDAILAREHNNANVLCLAGRRLTLDDAWPVVRKFIFTDFSKETRHVERLGMFE